jgi:UDP-glucose:(heptosyl)LPS alpha-1,3-glucosyltransferase
MRLAIVRQHYHPDGAVERVTERALEALLERNVAVSLYTRSWPQTRLQLIEPVICDPFFIGRLWRDWGFASAACRSIRRTMPSLVESHEPMLCCDVYRAGDGVHAIRLAERLKHASPVERLSLACSPHSRYLIRTEERLYASPWLRAVICKSKMIRDEIHARFAVPESKLPVIYNPVDSERFHPGLRAERARILERHGVDVDATVYLVVCRDFEHDSIATAIDALAGLPPPAHLIVITAARGERTRAHAQKRGVSARVTTVDSHVDVRHYYGAADVFVSPSVYDPSPDTALEAMACGLPVIGSTKSGVAELLDEHQCGLACPSRDVTALAAHMRSLQDAAMRARFGENARRAVLPLSPAATTLSLVLLYRDLLAATVPRSAPRTTTTTAGG